MKDRMKALVYHGEGRISLEDRPVPRILEERDVIVRVTRSTICTSDLHIIRGAVPKAVPGIVLGHEFVGEVVETGAGVRSLKPGDRVAANCETFCGECWFCRRGYINNCVRGGWKLGCEIDGCQAEYVRVPYGDMGLTRLPDEVGYEQALFVGDILSSGYFGAELAEIRAGDTVAVIGAGPVGLCAAECARLMGAGTVIMVDVNQERLELAKAQGLADLCLNPERDQVKDAVAAVTEGRGTDGVIEAAGGGDTFRLAWEIARPNAVVAVVAMYEESQVLPLPDMYGKNLIFKTGGVDARHCKKLVELIAAGRLNTDFLITHRGSLKEILEGYRIFEEHRDGCMKWVVVGAPEAVCKKEKCAKR